LVGEADVAARRRRRVPGAVRARVRREGAAGGRRRERTCGAGTRAAGARAGRESGRRSERDRDRPGRCRLPRRAPDRRLGPLRRRRARRRPPGGGPQACALPLRRAAVRLAPGPAFALLAALGAAALLADRWQSVLALTLLLLAVCLRGPAGRRRIYLAGTLTAATSVFLLSPLAAVEGSHPLWTGPTVPVIGP